MLYVKYDPPLFTHDFCDFKTINIIKEYVIAIKSHFLVIIIVLSSSITS